jgi:hypothetical protein
VYDTKSTLSGTSGLNQGAFCNALQLNTLTFADQKIVSSSCTTSQFTTTVTLFTGPKNPAPGTPVATHQITCKFNVQIDSTCKKSSNSGKDDNKNKYGHKRQSDNLPCSGRRTRDECLNECTGDNFLLECTCLYDNRLNDTQNDSCPPGKVCCWNMPCEKWEDPFQCLRGGGSLDGTTPANCDWVPLDGGGEGCRCRAPLVNAGMTPRNQATKKIARPLCLMFGGCG